MGKFNYSIIIPTKNIPSLLNRALKTIPERRDIQVIVVDDNSDPEKVDFNHYPGLDKKNTLVIFNKDGLGAGHARNVGLKHAEGKWLLFMDSDDLYTDDAFSFLDDHLNDDSDIIFFGITSARAEDLSPCDRHKGKMEMIHKYMDDERQLHFYCRYFYNEPWGKMIKSNLVFSHNIEFDESMVANDYMFSVKIGYFANKIQYDDRELYCVTERQGSISDNQYGTPQKIQSRLDVYYRVQLFMESKKIKLYPLIAIFLKMCQQPRNVRNEMWLFIRKNHVKFIWLLKSMLKYIMYTGFRICTNRYYIR